MKRLAILALLVGFAALPLFAQSNPTGTLSGHVTDGTNALPGVTVSTTSPNLQGTRTAVTTTAGDYIFTFLPPGEYRVRFELQGFQTLDTSVKINAAQTSKLDAVMPASKVAEEVTVTGSYDTISAAGTAATTYTKEMIYKLPMPKNLENIALMTAGVVTNPGTQNALIISGAPSYENQFLVNGVAIMDNVRGTATVGLYIEDAVQETTTTTSGISAEYGRFTGGVVNMLTKSGGNEFHGSLRDTMTSDSWTEDSPLQTTTNSDTVNNNWEATLGGFLFKDHLWFFGAYQTFETSLTGSLGVTQIPVSPKGNEQDRFEAKLTFALNPNHRIVGSYLKTENNDLGYWFLVSGISAMDLANVYDRSTPRELAAANYTGVLTDNFFVEAQYSNKKFTFLNSGSRYTDIAKGTPLEDFWNFDVIEVFNSPIFCAVCPGAGEKRDNKDYLLKASWFLSGEGVGSHDIVLGYDRFEDMRLSNNWQSGSGYQVIVDGVVGYTDVGIPGGPGILDENGSPYPVIIGGSGSSWINYTPISLITEGNKFRTDSIFLNDKWRLNNNWSFNIGLRYDMNHGEDGVGTVVTDDSNISPRLAVTFDPKGDGKWLFNASYATYVAAIAGSVADVSAGGTPASIYYDYRGPDFNTNCDPNNPTPATCLNANDSAEAAVSWLLGLTQDERNALLLYASVPGYNSAVPESLQSPNVQEITIGASTRLGTRGSLRFDYVNRTYKDFYSSVIDTTTGQSEPDPYGNVYDMIHLKNTSDLTREYSGFNISGEYRIGDTITIGGNYTYSTMKGDIAGETGGSGPVEASIEEYPEYKAFAQNNPEGYLPADQRHRLRLFGVWDIINSKHNRLSLSLVETFASGTPYSATGSITIGPYVTNPGYLSPPSSVTYYFSDRGAYRWDDITRTDLGFTYAFVIPALGTEIQFFLEPRMTNVFNEHGQVGGNTTVYTSRSSGRGLVAFNPFTDTPKECPQTATAAECTAMGANWKKGPNFGKPTTPTTPTNALGNYQMPRTYVISLGVRF